MSKSKAIQDMERNIALTWFEGNYTQEQAQLESEIQNLSFENIANHYANFYHETECLSCGFN